MTEVPETRANSHARTGVNSRIAAVQIGVFVLVCIWQAWSFPAWQPPDEYEHALYANALAYEGWIHPIPDSQIRRHGIEAFQPSLYYWGLAALLRLTDVHVPQSLLTNPQKNPNYPYVVSSTSGWQLALAVGRGFAVLLGLFWAWGCWRLLSCWLGGDGLWLLPVWLLAPHTVQLFSSISNDALALVFSVWSLQAISAMIKSDSGKSGTIKSMVLMLLACMSKMTSVILAPVWLMGWIAFWLSHRNKKTRKAIAQTGLFGLITVSAFATLRLYSVGDLTGSKLLDKLTPGFSRVTNMVPLDAATPVMNEFGARFLLDWGHQSLWWDSGSLWLSFLWLACLGFAAFSLWQDWRQKSLIWWLSSVALGSASLAIVFLMRNYVVMTNIQIRHSWFLLLLSWLSLAGLLVKHPKVGRWTAALVSLTLASGLGYGWAHQNVQPSKADAVIADTDYVTFRNLYVQNREDGYAYLRTAKTLLSDARQAYGHKRFREAYRLAKSFLELESQSIDARLIAAASSFELENFDIARDLMEPLPKETAPVAILWLETLLACGENEQATEFVDGLTSQRIQALGPSFQRVVLRIRSGDAH